MSSMNKFRGRMVRFLIQLVGNTQTINSQSIVVKEIDSAGNVTKCTGTVTITDSGAGYAKGCEYVKTDVTAGTSGSYVNIGSTSACQFVLVGTISAASVGVSNLTSATLAEATVTLTAAQVKALFTTPITLVAAPGAGSYISVDEIRFKMVYGTAQYTGANNVEFRYTNGAGAKVTADVAAATLNAASTSYRTLKPVTTELTPVLNAAVVVTVPTADPAVGDSPVTLVVRYHVVTP